MLDIFLGQCARNAAFLPIDSLNEPVDATADSSPEEAEEAIDRIVDPAADIAGDLIRSEADAEICPRVRAFVARLSPYLRCVALRLYWQDQSQTEIAAALGVTRSAICHAARRLEKLGRRELDDLAIHLR